MKYVILISFTLLLTSLTAQSQSALLSGINSNKSEVSIGEGDIYSEFKATESGNCTFEFSLKKYMDLVMDYAIIYQTYSWNWKDITQVTVGENKIELISDGNKINLQSKDKDSDKITPSTEKGVNLFLNSPEQTKQAASWIMDKINGCGGSATLK